jgi:uncharacterized protein (DUF58 family)
VPASPSTSPPGRAAPERLLLRLEWRVLRRLEGRLAGGYRTTHRGTGTDLAGLRDYLEGDDARHIDWNVTARLNEPQLRVFTEDRELTVWLVLDQSASMMAGAPGRGKDEVAAELAVLLARLFTRGGNQVGAVLYDNGAVRTLPPGNGRRHVLHLAVLLSRSAGMSTVTATGDRPRRGRLRINGHRRNTASHHRGTTNLAAMLDAVARLARRRALIIVISDFIGDGDWERSLLRLGPRHEVVALRVVDAADGELPEAGLVVVEDAETGEQLFVDTGDPRLRARLRGAVADRDARLAAGMRRAGVPVHRIGTDADLATALIQVVASTRRRRA